MRRWPLLLIPVLPIAASAQSDSAARSATSTVTGRVYCADTNAPARLASVMLEPVRAVNQAGIGSKGHTRDRVTMTAVQTTLDGSFLLPGVAPGKYYVIAYKPGYLSPLATFPADILDHPSAEDQARIAAAVPNITIQAGLPASIDLRLERGAAISGTVLFDDGSPAADLTVHALVRRKQGQKETWSALRPTPFGTMAEVRTDDLGRYRLIGLPASEYTVQVDLELQKLDLGIIVGESWNSRSTTSIARLPFYSGNSTRQRDAAPFKLTAGEERTGEDITIPLSKLHTVTGELIAAHDGHVLNYGTVSLRNADDQSEVESAKVEESDSKFRLIFVPEGSYNLHIDGAADVTFQPASVPPNTFAIPYDQVHFLHSYGVTDQPLAVHDDIPTLTVSIPEKAAAPPPPSHSTTASQ